VPRADEIIRELDKNLVDGIECLLDAATFEFDIQIMKHLIRTASFTQKFVDHQDFDANRYVTVVKSLIVLSKIRNSKECARAITYKQLEKFKHKNILKLLLKFRDYKLAIQLIDLLNLKQSLNMVYEEWAKTMLLNSTLSE